MKKKEIKKNPDVSLESVTIKGIIWYPSVARKMKADVFVEKHISLPLFANMDEEAATKELKKIYSELK